MRNSRAELERDLIALKAERDRRELERRRRAAAAGNESEGGFSDEEYDL